MASQKRALCGVLPGLFEAARVDGVELGAAEHVETPIELRERVEADVVGAEPAHQLTGIDLLFRSRLRNYGCVSSIRFGYDLESSQTYSSTGLRPALQNTLHRTIEPLSPVSPTLKHLT